MPSTTICIPRVEATMSRNYIEDIIRDMKIGLIETIREIPLHKDIHYKRVILKIRWDTKNVKTNQILTSMKENGSVNLVYDMPWYWKVLPAR
tara:strand:+ start:797 stop:1072 length:276 start_codon:yes stop_codon:yes gene_type:complete